LIVALLRSHRLADGTMMPTVRSLQHVETAKSASAPVRSRAGLEPGVSHASSDTGRNVLALEHDRRSANPAWQQTPVRASREP